LRIGYGEQRFPLDPQTYSRILTPATECLRPRLQAAHAAHVGLADAFDSLAVAFGVLPKTTESAPARRAARRRDQALHKRALADLCARSADALRCIEETLERINGHPDDPASFDALHALISEQVFRLASWRVAADDINYRRFFDINELAALRMEEPAVFEASHRLLFELIARGEVGGVRVDHIDGLYDPVGYLVRLRSGAANARCAAESPKPDAKDAPLYIVAEKITAVAESLPANWPLAGTTGYDFTNLVNGLFVDAGAEAKLTRSYFAFARERPDFDEILYRSKKLVMDIATASELNALSTALANIAQADRATLDFTYSSLRAALAAVVVCFPVYRTYVTAAGASEDDRGFIDQAIHAARRRALPAEATVFDFVRDVLTTDLARGRPEAEREPIVRFAMRFQQFTGPVAAKGMEDTAFYAYNRLASLNEVGGDPRRFGVSVAAFHDANAHRARDWPHAMLATSTHDSKRSEDVRARLDVLSELPAEWRLHAARWHRLNRGRKRKLETLEAPTRNDEYLLYQTLLGAWPDRHDDPAVAAEFAARIEGYLIKVVREAKAVSSWINPNEAYEAGLVGFARTLLKAPGNERFLADFLPFQRRVAWFGMVNGLAQTLLKLTAPGVPDIYQGCELWNLALVDPDNRRPVDFAPRRESLVAMQTAAAGGGLPALAMDLATQLGDGRLKQFLVWRALGLRRERATLFSEGGYVPLAATGERAEHVCAFARVLGDDCVVTVVPRLACTLLGGEVAPPIGAVWGDTGIDLSTLPSRAWDDALSGGALDAQGSSLPLAAILGRLPVALLATR
jgi:(1->4)-alpha-D-glucan 1-alpha-D-glucosylmutase